MSGKKGMKHYGLEFREELVRKNIEEGISKRELSREYGIHLSQIKNWSKWYKENGTSKQKTGKARGRPRRKEETLEEENRRLRMENEILKKFHELLKEETEKK